MLLLARMYWDTESADLSKLEFFKKLVLEVLEAAPYTDTNSNSGATTGTVSSVQGELYDLLAGHYLLNPSIEVEEITSRVLPSTATAFNNVTLTLPKENVLQVLELVRKQLMDDTALLRRTARVEGFEGIDCKALAQSGW